MTEAQQIEKSITSILSKDLRTLSKEDKKKLEHAHFNVGVILREIENDDRP